MKKLLIAGVVVLALIVAGVFLTLSNLGPLVKKTVNTMGPQITKTDVEVTDVSISIFSDAFKKYSGQCKGRKKTQNPIRLRWG